MAEPSPAQPLRVVVAGGGIGAIETVLALRALAQERVEIVVVAPNDRLVLPPLTVAEPFAAGLADAGSLREALAEQGADLRPATIDAVDADARTVACSDRETLPYDALVVATGGRRRAAYDHALTFGLGDPMALNGLLADLEQGYADSVAFVVPDGTTWSLPLYELALLTARQVWGMGRDVSLTLLTPEPHPLAVFGDEAGMAVRDAFGQARIALVWGSPLVVGRGRVRALDTGEETRADRIVSLPLLEGPRLIGLAADAEGFLAVDSYCRVIGHRGVYAVGDATDIDVKQGGLACQQADVVAAQIAAAAGADVRVEPLHPVLRGRLMTGRVDRFLRRELDSPHGLADQEPLWWPPIKVAGRYLGPWLAEHGLAGRHAGAATPPPPSEGPEVHAHLGPLRSHDPDVLGLDTLGPTHD
ncbi:MAG TPA: FAD-dependent oxidoreductase [Solirubrobacteraceae bacterium]|nr:FAD-dependent oxidoreductase [Solirubrobacteraceae bacterium]